MAIPPKPKVMAATKAPTQAMVPVADEADPLAFLRAPSAYAEELAQYAQEVKDTESVPGMKGIGTRSGILVIDDQEIPGNILNLIVVAHIRENQFFLGDFDENNPQGPDCYAHFEGKDIQGVFANELSTQLQNPQEFIDPDDETKIKIMSPCATCPQFVWGSSKRPGSRGKACKEVRKLVCLAWDGLTMENIETTEPRQLKIPVTSVGGWATYVNALAEFNRPPFSVVTQLGLVPDRESTFKMTFKPVAAVPDEFIPILRERVNPLKEALMVPYSQNVIVEQAPAEEAPAEQAIAAKVSPRVVPVRR